MDFFVPSATSPQQAEAIFSSIATHISAPEQAQRVYKLSWQHEGQTCTCEIGQPLPDVFRVEETVLAIFDCGDEYQICTPNRGAIKFEPVHAAKATVTDVQFFN